MSKESIEEAHQGLDPSESRIAYLKGERDVIIKKQSELQIQRDKVKVDLANAHKSQQKQNKGRTSKNGKIVSLEQCLAKFNLDHK